MSFDRLRIYIYTFLMVMLLVSCVTAADVVAKQSVLKAVETTDKLTAPVTVVNISKGYITSALHTESKNLVNNVVKKVGLSKSISQTSASLKGIDKYRATAEHIENNVNLIGKHSVIYGNTTMNITVQNQSYDQDTGMNKFNLTATINGKSLLIHNPFRVYGIPVTVKQVSNVSVYLDPLEIQNMIPIEITFANKTIVYNQSLYSYLAATPVTREVITEVDAPKDAVLQNLAYALSYIEYGEPTFDDPDPTDVFYASGSWTVPINTVNANMTVVAGGGGGAGGYGIATWGCSWVGYCSCDPYNPAMVTGKGVGGSAGSTNTTLYHVHDGEIYSFVVGTGGAGGSGLGVNCYTGCGDTGACDPPIIYTSSGAPGLASSAFSMTTNPGIPGTISGNRTSEIRNSSATAGEPGWVTPLANPITNGYGAGGNSGYAGSLTGTPYGHALVPGGAGTAGNPGLLLITYTIEPLIASWNSPLYSLNENGIYTYSVDAASQWDYSGTYAYYLMVANQATPSVTITSQQIFSPNGTASVYFDSTAYTAGVYNGYIKRYNVNTGGINTIGYASTQLTLNVRINGYLKDAVSGGSINSGNVNIVQTGNNINNVTTGSGYYSTYPTAFQTGIPITINATKSGYYPYNVSFTPLTSDIINLNISLVPTTIPSNSIGGITGEYPYGKPVPGATATVSNLTNTQTNVSNEYGFYFIGDTAPGTTYTVQSTKTGYVISPQNTVLAGSGFTEQNTQMNATYTFTGNFIDSVTSEMIPKVTVTDNLGYSTSTTVGTFTNTYPYGTVDFTFTAPLYASKSVSYTMDSNEVVNITLTKGDSTGNTMYFTPHKVRFFCRDLFGKPIANMTAQVYGVQTTLGSLDWVASLFGINLDVTPITTTLMTGTTGSDGSIVFIMLETEKYSIHYVQADLNINETRYYYPKQEEYIEIFWPEQYPVSSTVISYPFVNTSINSTHTLLGVTYSDTLATTTNLTFYIDNDTVSNSILHTQHRIYTYTSNSTTANRNITINYTVPNIPGGGYFWGIIATSTQYADPIIPSRYLSFDANQWKINLMGAANGDATAAMVYNAAAIGIIVIFALIFGRAAIKFGVVIVPLMGLFFWWIGWLQIAILLITIALALGILMYLRYSEEDG